ncbi:fimbrial protein [Burkholderia sp. BCC0044]|uniref:fimbrial protein n=1 Tax=Burkholderia sp. BCC0044 TaxID=2676295 RepID=UPI00158D43BA|nr:fimbrial protein [Burkholderia sp. BCC0044]
MKNFVPLLRHIGVGMLLAMGLHGTAQAICKWSSPNGAHSTSYTVMPSRSITLQRVPVGQRMAIMKLAPNLLPADKYYICDNDFVNYRLDTSNLAPSGYPNVWKTSIPGIGVTLAMQRYDNAAIEYLPFSFQSGPNSEHSNFPNLSLVFVRIGVGVVSGEQEISFKASLDAPGLPKVTLNVGPARVNIVNDVYFESCSVVDKAVTVQMGQEQIERIKRGTATEHPFGFDVRCLGLKPNAAGGSVRVYFEGNAVSDGLLRLSSTGTNAATGMGIALVNDSGVKLPFSKARALPLKWNRSEPEGEMYRFSGTAKYAPTSGTIKPGEADAVMNFVIEYN